MKRLFFSDLHLHTWAYGSSVMNDGFNSRLFLQWAAIREMVTDAHEKGVRYAYFCGDLFHVHGTVPTQALIVAGELFRELRQVGIKVRAIAGNHDAVTRNGMWNALQWLPRDELVGTWDDHGLRVRALPYTEDEDRMKAFLGKSSPGELLLLHQGVQGVPLSSGYVPDEKLSPDMIPDGAVAFTGHYHFHKVVSPRLTVVGNLTPLNWSDVDQSKGWVYWDEQTGEIEQVVQRSSPSFITWDYEQDINLVAGNFVRYTKAVKQKDMEKIRADLLKEGALTVEFPTVEIDVKKNDKIRKGEEITIESVVKGFETSEMTPRRKEVGLEIREERYASTV